MRAGHYKTGKRDANEPEIIGLLRAAHILYTQFKPGAGADLLVWVAPLEIWEIKNPEQAPSDRVLTEKEVEVQAYCEARGIPYRVIQTVDEALHYINRYMARSK